jgi:hypothetical protein
VVVGDDRLGTGQWECAGGGSSRERERYNRVRWWITLLIINPDNLFEIL